MSAAKDFFLAVQALLIFFVIITLPVLFPETVLDNLIGPTSKAFFSLFTVTKESLRKELIFDSNQFLFALASNLCLGLYWGFIILKERSIWSFLTVGTFIMLVVYLLAAIFTDITILNGLIASTLILVFSYIAYKVYLEYISIKKPIKIIFNQSFKGENREVLIKLMCNVNIDSKIREEIYRRDKDFYYKYLGEDMKAYISL